MAKAAATITPMKGMDCEGGVSLSSTSSNENENGKSANSHNFEGHILRSGLHQMWHQSQWNGKSPLPPSQYVINNHWWENNCITGYSDSEKGRKSLETELRNIRLSAYQDPRTVATVAADHFPVNSEERNELICGNCLFHAETMQNFNKHFGKRNKLSCIKSPIRTKMVQGKYGKVILRRCQTS